MTIVLRMPRPLVVGAIVGALMGGCAVPWAREPGREEVLQRILPSAVQIVIEQHEGRRVRTASGVVLAASQRTDKHHVCFVLTAGHTVSGIIGEKGVYVVFGGYNGDVKKVQATVVMYRDTADLDLALLRVEADRCVPAPAAGPPMLGESVWVVGFPWGRHMTLATGIVSQINANDSADRESASQLMVDASVSYGSSGGGVYTARNGALIGVVRGYSTARVSAQGADPPWYIDVPVPGQTYVTPLSDVRRFLAETGYADLIGPPNGPARFSGGAAGRAR
jgi:S1-C subfamily serine protease